MSSNIDNIKIPITDFNVRTAINKLNLFGCSNSKEYWINHYFELKYLDLLLINIALYLIKKSNNKKITNLADAINVLVSKEIISSPAYWRQNVDKINYLDQLLINVANTIE